MKVLITGSNGLLGQKLVDLCLSNSISFLATSSGANRNYKCPQENYATLDITDEQNIVEVLHAHQPTHLIHTAAMTNVDQCELHPEACDLVNRQSVQMLANYCQLHQIHFQLLSTDFVFDGLAGPYAEEDQPNPLSVYARSKVEAEKIVQTTQDLRFSIVRTIIVYGEGEQLSRSNLILWAKNALQNGEPLQVVDDQFRAPTWADDLAWACLRICALNQNGIFHISGPETLSIYEIVLRLARFYNLSAEHISKVSSEQLQQPAKRPPRTGFKLDKARHILGYEPSTLEQTFALLK
jgi:dTDP-4-dehydrorhamnose reductase